VRVYLPATVPALRRWRADGQAPSGPAAAVTPGLREWYREGDQEELEWAAQQVAARLSLEVLAAEPEAPRRRVVLAVDVADADVALVDEPRGTVTVGAVVPDSAWASVLVDDEQADVVISAAATALGAAAADDEDAAFTVDEADATELGWYGVQEIDHLLERG
jgi:hypothetical protein